MTRSLISFIVFSALWWLIVDLDPSLAVGGVVFAALATVAHDRLTRGSASWRIHPGGAIRFLVFFLAHSVTASIDVALRALSRPPRLAPTVVEFSLRLADETPRIWFMNTINLLPGTLTVFAGKDAIKVHVLDRNRDVHGQLERIERIVAAVFGVTLDASDEGRP